MNGFSTAPAEALQREVRTALGPSGLMPFGWVVLNGDDFEGDVFEPGRGLLIGNIGSSLWPAFSTSPERADGQADPLDRWTVAQLAPLADRLGATMRYPFGRPLWPFQDYAKRATGMDNSPLGLLIHPQYGLWTALRGLMVFKGDFDVPVHHVPWHPCDHCVEKPCLTACPVSAFSSEGYDYVSCRTHVASNAGTTCLNSGCLARQACPVGDGFAYDEDHQAFHMSAIV
ncbi:MAG: ferredoxin [Pseudomonadota bacterium]